MNINVLEEGQEFHGQLPLGLLLHFVVVDKLQTVEFFLRLLFELRKAADGEIEQEPEGAVNNSDLIDEVKHLLFELLLLLHTRENVKYLLLRLLLSDVVLDMS